MLDLTQISLDLTNYQYLILFLAVVIEGPIATVVAGFLFAQSYVDFFLIYPFVIVADLIGDTFYYSIGRWGKKIGFKIFRLKNDKLQKLEETFNKNGGKAMLLGKLAHGIGGVFIFVAGVTRMPYGRFLLFNALGSAPKSLILILIGYFFGASYIRIGHYFNYYSWLSIAIGIITLIAYLLIAKKIKKKTGL